NEKRDAWFIGFTPEVLALTWVGFDDNTPVGISGSDGAVPIWARYMSAITAGQANRDFAVPAGIVFAEICQLSGGRATEYCPPRTVLNDSFKAGTEPGNLCPLHMPQPVPLPMMVDQFGNPISLDSVIPTSTEGGYPAEPMTDPTIPPPAPPPDSTLTGGVFRSTPPATTTGTTAPTTTTGTSTPPTGTQSPPPTVTIPPVTQPPPPTHTNPNPPV
ncbi:MAG TPA: hypothetical protein VFL80_00455, partial [Thermoanaerobaculia bacterium]|nr:hypothetical protein [Thermoanaerobaculia bacterium]